MLFRTKLIRCSGGILAFGAVMLSLADIRSASARDQRAGATEFSSRNRHHWRLAPLLTAPAIGVVTSGGLTTALASRSGYNHDPYVGYYGGPIYYGGPYYYRPYFDGAGPIYFGTHPIVDW